MARIRSVHPGLFTDEAFAALPMAARMLLVGLWTEADDHGVFEWKPLSLKMKLFPADAVEIEPLLIELVNAGIIAPFAVGEKRYAVVRNFRRYQRPKKASYKHPLPDQWRGYAGLKAESPEPVPHLFPTAPEKTAQREEEGGKGEKEQDNKTDSRAVATATRPYACAFEEFWSAYPRRKGANPKTPARKRFDAALRAGTDPQAIIAGVRRCAQAERDNIGTPYIPQAVKWLSDRRWEDYARDPQADTARPPAPIGFYAAADSEQLAAWDAWSRATHGHTLPRDRNFGWRVAAEWPPGDARATPAPPIITGATASCAQEQPS